MRAVLIAALFSIVFSSWLFEVASKRNSYRIDRLINPRLENCRDGSVCGFREAWNSCLGDDFADGCEFHLQTDVELDDVLHFSQLSQIPAIDGDLGSKEIHIRGRNTVVRHSSGHPRHSVSSSSTPRFMSLHGSRKHKLSLILEDLTIEGFGHEDIDGGAMSLSGLAAVHVANVQFRNSVGRHGGGLRIADVGHMVIANASFDNIVATGSGGALFLDISHTNRVELSSLTVRDCEADRGSLVHIQPSSVETDCVTSACSSETEIFLSDAHVEYATRTSIVHVDNGFSGQQFTMYIVGTKVVAQPSSDLLGATDGVERDHAGVALFDLGARMSALMLHDVVFELEEHHVIDDRPISAVAIQHTSKVQLSHVMVTASAQSNVSGIVATNVTSLDVASSTFTGLSASFGPAIAVHNVSQVTIANCSFTHNIATGDAIEFRGGGAVYAESFDSFVCSSSGFESNQAPNGFGGALMVRYGTSVGLDRNRFYINTAGSDGGSVYVSHINTTVAAVNSIFFQDGSSSRGGGLFASDIGTAEIVKCQFLENTASTDGGAMYTANAATLTITDTSFESNRAGGSGGGLAAQSITELVSLVNSSCVSNVGETGGGLFLSIIDVLDVTELTINGNTANSNGGGVYCDKVMTSHWRSIQAAENQAGTEGGALFAQNGESLDMYQFNATHNKAIDGSGGAIATYFYSYTTLEHLTLFNNEASEWGGGIMQSSIEGTYIGQSRIILNTAGSSGGGVRFTHPSSGGLFRIHTSEIIGNIAYGSSSGGNGGGVSVFAVNSLELNTVKLQNNEALAAYGGAMAVEGCNTLNVLSTEVVENTAATHGGGFLLKNTILATLKTVLFEGNRASSGDGGALYCFYDQGYTQFVDWTFIRALRNVAAGSGGGIYLTNVNMLAVSSWYVMGNVASTGNGGGIYLTKMPYHTSLKDLNVTGNNALKGHGGGIAYISAPLANNIWERNYIHANVAGRSGGGLYVQELGLLYLIQMTLVGNQGTDYGGGMYVDALRAFLVDEMTIRANVASMGGGMHVASLSRSGALEWSYDNVFDGNRAEAGGAMSFGRTNRFYTVNTQHNSSVSFYNNQANYGSVLYAVEYGLHNRSIYQSDVINNTALGGGTFFFLVHTDVVSNRTQWQIANPSLPWPEPLTIDPLTTTIKGNTAKFGTLVASQMIAFEGPSVYHAVPNGYDFDTPIVFSVFQDFFNQTLPDDSFRLATPITAYECSGVIPSISTTGSDGEFRRGTVSFQRTSIGCAQGGFVNVQFTVAYDLNIVPAALSRNEPTLVSSGVHTATMTTQIRYRTCLRGERVVGTRCTPCGNGEYSFRNDSEVCEPCTYINGIRSCRQQHLDLKPGYWRYDEDTFAVIPCWSREACVGGEATGTSLCRTGYEGPACGVCSAGYFSNGRKCKRCDGRSELTGGILLLIALTVSITALLALYLYRQKIRIQTLSAILVYVRQSYPKIISKVKVILATFQIVANIPVTLQIQLPLIFMRYLTTLEVFNLNFGVMFPFACAISLDYMQFLLLVTLLPIGLSVALCVGFLVERYGLRLLFPIRYYRAKYVGNNGSVVAAPAVDAKKGTSLSSADPNHSTIPPAPAIAPPRTVEEVIASYQHEQEEHRRIRTRYLNMWFYLTYLVLPAATTAVFQVFNCTDIDPYKENPELSSSRFMTADMRISCDSAYYLSWIPYTIAMVVVYPIGIPLTYFLVLYAHREEISTRDVVADEEREVWLYQQLFSKPTPTPMKAADSSVAAAVEANDSDDGIDNTRQEKELAGYSGSDSVVTKSLSPEGDVEAALCASTDDPETSTPAPLSEDSSHTEDDPDLVYLQSLPPSLHPPHEYTGKGQDNHGNENVGETLLTGYATNLSPEVTGLAFLWSAYEPRFWYWEVIETIRRIILTAVIAIISPGTSLQSILAILFAIFFLQLYGVFAPYEDDEDDTLANIGQIQVFLTFFAALIVQNQLVSETWFNLLGILMIVINVVMYAMPFVFLARRLESMARIYRRQQELMSKMDAMGLDKDVDEDNNSDSGSGGGVVGGLSKGVVSAHEYAGPQEASDPSSNPNHDAIGEVTSTVREQDVEEKAADSGDHRNPPVPPLHTPSTASLSRSHSARPTTEVAPPKKRTQLHRYRSEMSLRLAMEMERTSTYHAHHKQRYRHHPDEPSPQFPWSPAAMRAFHAMQSLVSESPMKPVDPGTTPLSRQSSVRRPPAPPTRQWSTDSLPPSTAAAVPAAASPSASAHAVPARGEPRSQSTTSSS